ncbi:flagellar hook-basal body complex protein FliE [Oribacterium sp. WCC10]|uniref:flagellar hook-basal body complex protein FliE n=1 Tax=Oribacterium sp. WCC10 TaxID=1855343 RepID=UPI0008E1F724|nr:flagellar hook-basal body complex protein FliE [Oribacterium sp. WCC10]SFG25196.1 flagellar hook-basal body complex protein FliE [Oribacterium sp. WCC10]
MEINNQFITPMKPWTFGESVSERNTMPKESEGATLFKDIFANAVNNVKLTQADVENKQYLLATGQLEDAHSLPIAESKAAISLSMMVTLRNKALASYNELIKMNT